MWSTIAEWNRAGLETFMLTCSTWAGKTQARLSWHCWQFYHCSLHSPRARAPHSMAGGSQEAVSGEWIFRKSHVEAVWPSLRSHNTPLLSYSIGWTNHKPDWRGENITFTSQEKMSKNLGHLKKKLPLGHFHLISAWNMDLREGAPAAFL
jgi:hypothetical protein